MSRDLPSCVAIVGFGYVGLPLASAFAKVMPTIGFDVDRRRILEILDGKDRNGGVRSRSRTGTRRSCTGPFEEAV